ncbi:MAG: BCSC C-terminal domain-containing protein [Acetobacteraceae bacterium]|nr:BCSC C-terminal domain-containing protein [Acetobacteraceae bacterium]
MTHRQRLLVAVFGTALSLPAHAQDARGVQALLDQANYWRLQNRPELVVRTLERVLAADPRNVEALAQSAQAQAQLGNRAAAEALLGRLRQVAPQDPRLGEADVTVRAATVDQGALQEARRLAQAGRAPDAVQRYRDLFRGQPVPDIYAVEFYQTLAGTDAGYEEARNGLQAFAARNPADTRGQLALAQVLTFRDATRADGIRRLRQLADNPEASNTAIAAWRQALLWQGASRQNVPELEAFLQRFPNDTAVAQRLEESRNPPAGAGDEGGLARIRGFEALNRGNLREAEREFQSALALNANDADALGGVGLVRLRAGRFGEARQLIERAIAIDPEARGRYGRALDGAAGSAELASARSALQRGDLATAESNLRRAIQRESTDRADAEALLGDIALRRGDLQGAEQRYRAALARRPNLGQAASGLYEVLQQQGRFAEAEDIQRRLGVGGGDVANTRSNALRAEAQRVSDPGQQAQLLAEAVRVDPNNPWARLDLARLLASVGRNGEARQIVEGPALQTGSPEALFAAALFAESDNRPNDATALISRVPDRVRTPDMQRLLQRTRVLAEADGALALYQAGRRAEARQQLLALAARRDPTGASATAALRTLGLANDRQGAVEAGRLFLANNPNAPGSVRVQVAGALLGAGAVEEANLLARTLETAPGLTAEDRRQAQSIQTGLAIRQADRLNERGDQAAAFDVLAPALQRDPSSVPANLALARLYQGAGQPRQAQAITEGVLQQDPTSVEARFGAVEAAIAARDFNRAEALLVEARAFNPNDPRVSLLEARIARANGNSSRALRALEMAAEQRRAQGFVDSTPTADGTISTFDNPFRRLSRAGAIGGASAFQSDPLSGEIARELTAVREETAARIQGGLGFRTRSGTNGLDRLEEYSAPIDVSFSPPRLGGRVTLSVTPTSISSGQIDTTNTALLRSFGTNALASELQQQAFQQQQITQTVRDRYRLRDTTAEGVGLGLAYSRGAFSVDIGTSPIGFRRQNILGGIEIAPSITQNTRVRLIAEQRSVTDSLLSWSGVRDPSSGRTWGGVVRTGGRVQLEYVTGPVAVYMLGGYSTFTGTEVQRNNRFEAGAGAQYALWRLPNEELTVGVDLVYFGYDNNQRLFTFGNGGYFSPQSYFSVGIPVDWRMRSGNFAWRLGGTLGFQSFREDAQPFFPRNPDLQAQLETQLQGNNVGVRTVQPGQTQSGVIGGVRADLEYSVTPNFRIGGLLRYERTGNWEEARGLVFARYRFDR